MAAAVVDRALYFLGRAVVGGFCCSTIFPHDLLLPLSVRYVQLPASDKLWWVSRVVMFYMMAITLQTRG